MTGIELDRIQIRTPCPKSWDEMQGDARTRFCTACSLHVHNLSALPREEGEALLAARATGGARLCVTYARRADGTLVTAEAPAARAPAAPRRPWGWRAVRSAASLLGAVPFLSALAGAVALAGCGDPAAGPDPEPAPADPGAPVVPPPSDPDGPRLTGEVAMPEPVLQIMGGIALGEGRELGKVAVEQGDVALPPPERN